ncbi:OmpA/MotB family protein [Solidesulfovibrio carbinolicus]|uniref:OmpA-like domain-containing protein n=1 Tax=Solidesulfovibrio carbinolicus TaxID=296842 RepID=A0A4P6HKT7_9BACT|nr:OmpA family protein [Solidesulfovibrio carbinolicus]QAZ67266.1 hypothetical protein C3Y92_08500 [Solidesulfovibrio carbinolicus]
MAINEYQSGDDDHEQNFFVSMTDMMVGMLFLFIIMLMFFAMKFSDDSVDLREQNVLLEAQRKAAEDEKNRLRAQLDLIQGAQQARQAVVEQVYQSLKDQGVTVLIDRDNGILRLPESILFPVSKAELLPEGKEAVTKLARALAQVLPCYATLPNDAPPADCPPTAFGLEALLIEGHTDSDGAEDMNWRLSMERALHTYQVMTHEQPALGALRSRQIRASQDGIGGAGYPLMSVAGYGLKRPVAPNTSPENKRRNRRIDIRFIMTPPSEKEVNAAKRLLE